ncbi:unnamed protein product [Symbiodinium sp. KB8]|nr:unnamed protein product [Symbiodinium sp. KB8]
MDRRKAAAAAKAARLRDAVTLVTHQLAALQAILPTNRGSKSPSRRGQAGVAFSVSGPGKADRSKSLSASEAFNLSTPEERGHLDKMKAWVRQEWGRRDATSQFARSGAASAKVPAATRAAFLKDAVWAAPYSPELHAAFKKHAAELAAHRRLVNPLPHEQYSGRGAASPLRGPRSMRRGGGSASQSPQAFFSPRASEVSQTLKAHGFAAAASGVDEQALAAAERDRARIAQQVHRRVQEGEAAIAAEESVSVRAAWEEEQAAAKQRDGLARPGLKPTPQQQGPETSSSAVNEQLIRMQEQLQALTESNKRLLAERAASTPATGFQARGLDGVSTTGSEAGRSVTPEQAQPSQVQSSLTGAPSLYDRYSAASNLGASQASGWSAGGSSALVMSAGRGSPTESHSATRERVPAYRGGNVQGFQWGTGAHTGAATHAGSRAVYAGQRSGGVAAPSTPQSSPPRHLSRMVLPFSGGATDDLPVPVVTRRSPKYGASHTPEDFSPRRRRPSRHGRGPSESKTSETSGAAGSTALWMGLTGMGRGSPRTPQSSKAESRRGAADSPALGALDMYRARSIRPGGRRGIGGRSRGV